MCGAVHAGHHPVDHAEVGGVLAEVGEEGGAGGEGDGLVAAEAEHGDQQVAYVGVIIGYQDACHRTDPFVGGLRDFRASSRGRYNRGKRRNAFGFLAAGGGGHMSRACGRDRCETHERVAGDGGVEPSRGRRGEGAGRRPAVVLLHGFPEDARSWGRRSGRWRGGVRGARAGRAGGTTGRGGRRFGRRITCGGWSGTWRRWCGRRARRAHVVGHDWGGMIAWTLRAVPGTPR